MDIILWSLLKLIKFDKIKVDKIWFKFFLKSQGLFM